MASVCTVSCHNRAEAFGKLIPVDNLAFRIHSSFDRFLALLRAAAVIVSLNASVYLPPTQQSVSRDDFG